MTTFPTSMPLIVSTPACADRTRVCEPVTMGVPFPAGLVHEPGLLRLEDDEHHGVPLQARTTEYWGDGSIRWALLDFQITGPWIAQRRYTVRVGGSDRSAAPRRVAVKMAPGHATVDTGAAQFTIQNGTAFPFASVIAAGRQLLDPQTSGLLVTTPDGRSLDSRITRISVEEPGPLRSTVLVEGTIGPVRSPRLLLTARLQFFAGSSAVRVALTVRNPKRARHQGGIWELGDHGSTYLRDLSLRLGLATRITHVDGAAEAAAPLTTLEVPVEIYQDSSGGPNWQNIAHVDRHGDMPSTFQGYRLENPTVRHVGLRATPVLVARHDHGRVGLAVEHFWQNWPRAAAAEPDALVLRLFPGQCANEHELQGGEQKTHRFTLMFGDDDSARDAAYWGRASSFARLTPAWYCDSGAVPCLTPAGTDRYQQLVDAAIEGPASFAIKREAADEYGWRHHGDLPADHEQAFSGLTVPIVSHYNNQYDAVAGCAQQFLRSGDGRWHQLMTELAGHVTDIDIYHTDGDKSAYNHGMFWHTAHYVTAGRSSHRSYPRDPRVQGGGPSNEHNYTSGLRLHWLLTGEPQSRDAAIELATWVINMDDGSRTILRWLSSTPTGLASQTYSPTFHGPGRGAGHSILALLDGHRLTRDEAFLEKADQLVRRCIHPADDIERLTLLDAERRWSYTVFLQALGRYLDYRVELNRLDSGYAYGRAALTHYARWMAGHEYPYLDKPEILEYPTETWAAQDMRKCDVFLFAAGHTEGGERDRFRERAAFFFDYSVSTLLKMPTRTLTRPLVLMLSNGYFHLSPHASDPRPEPRAVPLDGFGEPVEFLTQKLLAKQRLTVSASAAAVIVLTTISLLAFF